jgi:predicted glycosyltransferase
VFAKAIIAPLNWGLGHASRCIPIIRSLLHHQIEVIIASDGQALDLLRMEFPDVKCFELPSYNINYRFGDPVINMIWHSRRFSLAIYREHQVIQNLVEKEKPDLIISDNRFGVYSKNVFSIFISHQIRLTTAHSWMDPLGSRLNKWLMKPFDHIWIPDLAPPDQLAPKLSAPPEKSFTYIGLLSRLERKTSSDSYDLCGIISGPEPQRTRLEKTLTEKMQEVPGNHILILGKTNENFEKKVKNILFVSYMTSTRLNEVLNESRFVIARSGYSTIMDLLKTGKRAILIPTPGQPEQIYLAESLRNHPNFVIEHQKSVDLNSAIKKFNTKKFKPVEILNDFDAWPLLSALFEKSN